MASRFLKGPNNQLLDPATNRPVGFVDPAGNECLLPIILAQSGVATSWTGDTVEHVLASFTIPGGMIGPNGSVRITCLWSMTTSANNKIIRTRLGASSTNALSATYTASGVTHSLVIIRNRGAQNAQVMMANGTTGGGLGASASPSTATADTSVDQLLVFTAQLALATETITLEGYTVEVLPG